MFNAVLLAACLLVSQPPALAEKGFKPIFDGKTLNGWRGCKRADAPKGWSVKNGELTYSPGNEGGDIITTEQYSDFDLRLEWKIEPGGNSGIMYRVNEDADGAPENGAEYQVLDDARHPDGHSPFTSAGSCYALYKPSQKVVKLANEWNDTRIVCRGSHVEHWLNGVKIVEYEVGSADWKERIKNSKFADWQGFGTYRIGHITLQDHGNVVAYRNIRIRTFTSATKESHMDSLVGQPADLASSAYLFRCDHAPDKNPPEAWILMIQAAGLPFDKPVDVNAPAVKRVLCGLMWEEVRPIRRVELTWPSGAHRIPPSDQIVLSYFESSDDFAHTWWNPRTVKEAGAPAVSADGQTYTFVVPSDTWGVFAAVRSGEASAFDTPAILAFGTDAWKRVGIEIEWGFEPSRAAVEYSGKLEAYDAMVSGVAPLDTSTTLTGPAAWQSKGAAPRRGIKMDVLYIGTSRWRRVWPYHSQPEDVARSIFTVRTKSGSFSFNVADLEMGPIYAPEYGFFVRATSKPQAAETAKADTGELLDERVDSLPGVPKVIGWAKNVVPWFGANPEDEPGVSGTLTIPPHSVAMHPSRNQSVLVGWESPVSGSVSVSGGVAMNDSAGGSGIDWAVVAAGKVVAHGSTATGGSAAFAVAQVQVKPNDEIAVCVGAKNSDNTCDTTRVDLVVTEQGSEKRVWSLANDVAGSIAKGNPHGVWRFYMLPTGQGLGESLSDPPFDLQSSATSAREFLAELQAKHLHSVREKTRKHAEQTWEGAMQALKGPGPFPALPAPEFSPAMKVQTPDEHWNAQWRLGPWHVLSHTTKDASGTLTFNDFPFGILSSETYAILHTQDLMGMHKEAADGFDQWLSLPMQPTCVPGKDGYHEMSLRDRPLGHFSDGLGCLTLARGVDGWGGHMDGVHAMGPGAIGYAISEHFRLTGDREWLKKNIARIKANAEWILRQRKLVESILPGGARLWSAGLQPAHVVTPDSLCMHMQFYESEAYYWLTVKRTAEMLKLVDPAEGDKMATEAEAYRKDLVAAIDRSIMLTPVVPTRDGTYHSFVPFAPYVRGFASGAWGWRRCQGHVGAIYWDTVQSAAPLISPARLLESTDPRVQGHLDVLEDRLLLENSKVVMRTPNFDAERDWFAHAGWEYQCGLERTANILLMADDPPNFIRSMMNQYAVDIIEGPYTFREHTTTGPPDKSFEESCFLERFRGMLVTEDGDALWIARAIPREWLAQGKTVSVTDAPTNFGSLTYSIRSDIANGRTSASIQIPSRTPPHTVFLRLRHPSAAPIKSVTVNGKPWTQFDAGSETVQLTGVTGTIEVVAQY